MNQPKRFVFLAPWLLGLVGVVGCAATVLGVWILHARLARATENAFTTIDNSLAGIQHRLENIAQRVEASKITAGEIEDHLRQWTKAEARERLASTLEIDEKAERLEAGLHQATQWLELTDASVQLAQQGLILGETLGIPIDAAPAAQLLERIADLQRELTEVIAMAEHIRQRRMENQADEEEGGGRLKLVLRVVATLGSVEMRLEKFDRQVGEIQTAAREARAKTLRWLRIVSVGLTLILGWMAAGQGALCFLGWRGFCRSPA